MSNEKYINDLKLELDKIISKKEYENKWEYKFEKNTNLIPKKKNRLICIILSEDKGMYFLVRKKEKQDSFRFNKGLYIIHNGAVHTSRNGNRYAIYLEGISTPLSMANIEKYTEEVEFTDLDGTKRKTLVQKIKGLKYDAKILDIFTDRKLSENFTKIDDKIKYALITLLLVIVGLVMTGIGYGLMYYFR